MNAYTSNRLTIFQEQTISDTARYVSNMIIDSLLFCLEYMKITWRQ